MRVVLAHAAVDVLQLLHLLPHRPDDVRQALAPERDKRETCDADMISFLHLAILVGIMHG